MKVFNISSIFSSLIRSFFDTFISLGSIVTPHVEFVHFIGLVKYCVVEEMLEDDDSYDDSQ